MIDIHGAVILYRQFHQTFKTTRLKQTYSSEGDQPSLSPISGKYVIRFGINIGKERFKVSTWIVPKSTFS